MILTRSKLHQGVSITQWWQLFGRLAKTLVYLVSRIVHLIAVHVLRSGRWLTKITRLLHHHQGCRVVGYGGFSWGLVLHFVPSLASWAFLAISCSRLLLRLILAITSLTTVFATHLCRGQQCWATARQICPTIPPQLVHLRAELVHAGLWRWHS